MPDFILYEGVSVKRNGAVKITRVPVPSVRREKREADRSMKITNLTTEKDGTH